MSKTDNTRPFVLQWDDPTKEYFISHCCGYKFSGTIHPECNYHPRNNLLSFKETKAQHRCHRVTYAYGGKRSFGGSGKSERKQRTRRMRRRERVALYTVRASNFEEDFDLKPIREDNRTLDWDLD